MLLFVIIYMTDTRFVCHPDPPPRMPKLRKLFERNRAWVESVKAHLPDFYTQLSHDDAPEYLWIGCSDSRVPANEVVGLLPGEHLVHRNIGNLVVHTDLNCLSVIQYAVDVLEVKHIIVCGHYECRAVRAVLEDETLGLVDSWLAHVRDVKKQHQALLAGADDPELRMRKLCELNVIEQVANVCATTTVRDAWQRRQELTVHAWIYNMSEGLLNDLAVSPGNRDELTEMYRQAVRLYL